MTTPGIEHLPAINSSAGSEGLGKHEGGANIHLFYVRSLEQLPEAKAYLDRIGGQATGPFSASVQEDRNDYVFDRASIRLIHEELNGKVVVTDLRFYGENGDLAPTEAEKHAIIDAAAKVRWPRITYVTKLGRENLPKPLEKSEGKNVFIFHDPLQLNRFCYVQNYNPGIEGRGKYGSWIHLNTDEWIPGQPDHLPLYGAEVLKHDNPPSRVFIHEGPKAADRVRNYLRPETGERLDHPWAEFLASGVHLGWPGGGDRHRKVDWTVLALAPRAEIIVVADADDVGRKAAQEISERHLGGRNVKVLEFPRSFTPGYDLADDWPDSPPPLQGMLRSPRYVGREDALEWGPQIAQVAKRIGERGLAFSYGGSVVQVRVETSAIFKDLSDPERKRPAQKLRTVASCWETILLPVEIVSRWQRWRSPRRGEDNGELIDVDAPDKILKLLIKHPAEFPSLAGVVDHAVIRDGQILSGDIGHDPDTGLYIHSPKVEVVEFADAKEALRFLTEDWLGRFPFQTPEDRLRALLIPLQLMLRRTEVRGGAPFVFVTAADAQTGKSWLVKTLYFVLSGIPPSVASFEKDEKEFSKQFLGALLEATSLIYYDNVSNGWHVGNADLDAYGTSDTFSKRQLGVNTSPEVSALSTVIFAGNNIVPSGDTITRSYEVRLHRDDNDAEENPLLRQAMAFTAENRGRVLGALLAIARTPPVHVPNVRFRDWAIKVAAPLMTVADVADLLEDMEETRSEVAEGSDDLAKVFTCIHRLQAKGLVFSGDIVTDPEAVELLRSLFRMKSDERLSATILGRRMTPYKDKQAGGMKLRIEKERDPERRKKSAAYRVEGEPRM